MRHDRFDACYYSITLSGGSLEGLSEVASGKDLGIVVKLKKNTNLNVFVYSGHDRTSTTLYNLADTEEDVDNPAQADTLLNHPYSSDVSRGILIVAYPVDNAQQTELEFSYGLEAGEFEVYEVEEGRGGED